MQRKGFNNLHVVGGDVNGKYFAFCSTLAVYVYDITSFQLHRLLSTADNLAGLAWCSSPQHGHWLATVSLSQKVVLYDVETEQILYHVLLPYHPVSFQWHPSSLQLVVATSDPSGKTSAASTLVGWTIDHTNRSTSVTTLQRGNTGMLASPSAITVIRFNTAGTLAIGNGNLAIYTAKSPTLRLLDKKKTSKKQSTGAPPGSPTANAIIDLQWDPLSTIYLLIATRDGHCALWEVTDDTGTPLHTFDKQGSGTSAVAWLPWGSGLFVTANARTGNLKLWNVSQSTPLEHVRVRPSGVGIHALALLPSTQHPQSAQVLATCGHDGAVRVWNTSTMECTHHLQPQDVGGIAYSVAWSPSNANRLVSASSLGTVYVWDLAGTLAPASQLTHHTDAVYCVAWRQPSANNAKSMLASSSKDKSVVIFYDAVTSSASPSREAGHLPLYIVRRYGLPCTLFVHEGSAYGCAWRPGNSGVLAVGGGDHVVRLFDVDNTDMDTPLRVLAAHEARVFHTVWSPHQSTHAWLATSSDDCTVRVWTLPPPKGLQAPPPPRGEGGRTEAKESKDADEAAVVPQKQQRGDDQVADGGNDDTAERSSHCSQPWSRTPPPLLLSGSWDGTIRIWDVERRECCVVVSDHLADVYGIATHPQAPSVFVSCSRDTTVRFWGLTTSATDQVVLQMMLQMTSAPSSREEMAELAAVVAAQSSAASSGVTNLMALLQENNMGGTKGSPSAVEPAKSTTTTATMVVPAEGQLLAVALEHARRLECGHGRRSKPTKLNQRDAVREAATQYLKAGAVQKYCQLLVEVEDWEAALAMAPAVSIEFWRQLAAKYADVLQAKQDESAVMYYLATHQVAKAVDVLQGRGQFNDACVMALVYVRLNRPKELQELAQVANVEKLEDSLEAFVSACQAIEMATTHLQAALSTSSLSVASSPTVSQKQLLLDVTYVLRSSDLSQVDTKYDYHSSFIGMC
ncbi:hypothetical protein DYB31_004034 [Aphanomyces astaci]|uniref:Gem-associated protein 5 TPR domain-containing protein n=2 Tax=Aphanomyces astaci TaxID=112090 RepID=A0A397F692_APHAT|nr:hypothetical protein DYB31_004034 [Aphanomyces astaci]